MSVPVVSPILNKIRSSKVVTNLKRTLKEISEGSKPIVTETDTSTMSPRRLVELMKLERIMKVPHVEFNHGPFAKNIKEGPHMTTTNRREDALLNRPRKFVLNTNDTTYATLAHELGHAKDYKTPENFDKVLTGMESNMGLLKLLYKYPYQLLGSEYRASRHGYQALKQLGIPKEDLATARNYMIGMFGSYLKATAPVIAAGGVAAAPVIGGAGYAANSAVKALNKRFGKNKEEA